MELSALSGREELVWRWACCWLWCKSFVQCLESTGRRFGACWAVPWDGLSTAGRAVLVLLHAPALAGRTENCQRNMIQILGTLHPWFFSSRMLLCFIPPDWYPYRVKIFPALGPAAGQGNPGNPATHAAWLSWNASSRAGQTFHTLGREEGK